VAVIGGLAAANALSQRGIDVSVYEQAEHLTEVGAGLGLAPNGMRILRRLGMGEAVEVRGNRWTDAQYCRPDGTAVARYLSLAKTLSDSLRSPEIRQSVHGPKTARLVGGRTTGIVRRWPCTVTPESRLEDGAWAGWAAELDR